MKTLKKTELVKVLIILLITLIFQPYTVSGKIYSRDMKEETWKFAAKDTLSLETLGCTKVFIYGSVSGGIDIKLRYVERPDEYFEVKEDQRTIYLTENILNYDRQRSTQTYFRECTWIINVPNGTYIRCAGSSGDFEVSGFSGFFKADHGLGKFVFNNVDGNIEILAAQLYAQIHNSKGSFNLSSAGGSIRARSLEIKGNSNFSSGMGIVKISLARNPEADLYVGSSFRKAQVCLKGHPAKGSFEFIARADGGRIISPVRFDKEETFLDDIKSYRDSSDFGKKSEYNRKSFIRGESNPKITLKTVTGIAQLTK